MVKKVKRTPNSVIQVELLQLDFTSLLQQTTQLLDDFCCALIIPANVGDSLLELTHVKWISREEDLRGLRVAKDGPQRLVEFMCEGGRQHACDCDTVQMNDLVHHVCDSLF